MRRRVPLPSVLVLVCLVVLSCGGGADPSAPKVVILGIDGLDHRLVTELMAAGRLPNMKRLAEQGFFAPLQTTVPPQSPVAWSSFMTGLDPGGHGIFDFLHRDPQSLLPVDSSAHTEGSDSTLKLGKWQVPLGGASVSTLRHGATFWEPLSHAGIESTILRMPANYPVSGTATRELSGMGTPDLTGTQGMFSYYTSELFAFAGEDITGGNIYELDVYDNVVQASLYGPPNPFLVEETKLEAPFTVYLDPEMDEAMLELGDQQIVLRVGEWSDWAEVEFEMVPTQTLHGIVRFYLRQVRPEFELYATAIEIDPMAPAMPISTPDDFAADLAHATGRFHTKGMPEDTKTMTDDVFEPAEFLAQAKLAGDEVIDQFDYLFDQFESGLFFYYFGNVDQICHIMFRTLDPGHPAYDKERDGPYADLIPSLYERMDGIVGKAMAGIDDDTLLVVMSDHGFASVRQYFHLNNWLREHGYLVLESDDISNDPGLLLNVDWAKTRAYAFGFNGLYLNLEGREREGIVTAAERDALLQEISAGLLAELDPHGKPAITKVHEREEVYHDRAAIENGPDLVIGYARGVRPSNESALGEFTDWIMSDNTSEWTGDHMMDFEEVPGILLTNRPLVQPAASIQDLAGSILEELGVSGFPHRDT